MRLLLNGPWDEAYYTLRTQIGRMHVKVGLAQKYMFGAMNLIRVDLVRTAQRAYAQAEDAEPAPPASAHASTDLIKTTVALEKILDLELAIMLETYREAFVERGQLIARMETAQLVERLAVSEGRHAEIAEKGEKK
jgi:hypothetical protein